MNENDPVEGNDDDEGNKKGLLAGGAAAAGGAAGLAKGALGKAKDAAAAAKDAAAGAAGSAKDAATGGVSGAKDAAAGAVGGVTGAAGSAKDAAAGAAGSAKDAAAGAAGGVTGAAGAAGGVVAGGAAASAAAAGGAVSGATGGVQDAASGVVASGAAASASVSGGTAVSGSAAQVSGGGAGGAGGSGGSGGFGGGSGGGGDDDDEDKLIAAAPVSGDNQIVILGLLAFLFLFFGGGLLAFFGFGGDDASEVVALEDVEDIEALAEENPQCGAVLSALADSEDLEDEDFENVTCTSDEDGEIALSGEVETDGVRSTILATAAGVLVGGNELLVDGEEVSVPEVEAVAAPEVTTTTAAPETTTTTAAPETTTTEAPAPEAFTMWDALNGSGEAVQFAVIGGALGLQEDLETLEVDGAPVMRTLFAPSDAALQELGPEAIAGLSADPTGAAALVGYHFLEETLTAEDLIALDGQTVQSRTNLPLAITVVDGQVVLNGTSVVTSSDFTADNGVVHIIDTVLQPPTLNQVLDLENIEFDPAQATITAAGQATLQRAVDFFTENEGVNAAIEGHTDSDGSDALNDELSQARADAVRQFLIDAGLDGDRFTATGFGETQLILVDGVEDKEASRRIEFVAQ